MPFPCNPFNRVIPTLRKKIYFITCCTAGFTEGFTGGGIKGGNTRILLVEDGRLIGDGIAVAGQTKWVLAGLVYRGKTRQAALTAPHDAVVLDPTLPGNERSGHSARHSVKAGAASRY